MENKFTLLVSRVSLTGNALSANDSRLI